MNGENQFIPNIEKLLGLTVDITLKNNNKFSGVIYTINQNSKMVILIIYISLGLIKKVKMIILMLNL